MKADIGAGLTTGGSLSPIIGFQMEFGNGRAILAQDQIDLRQKLRISKTLTIEVCHSPLLTLSNAKVLKHFSWLLSALEFLCLPTRRYSLEQYLYSHSSLCTCNPAA